jgi:uncharacterized protein YbjQ (UPF0145 family)
MAKPQKQLSEIQEAAVRSMEISKKLIDESKSLVQKARKEQKKIAKRARQKA